MTTDLEPRPLDTAPYGLKLREGQRKQLEVIEYRTGVPVPEQIRRGVDLWLKQQESSK